MPDFGIIKTVFGNNETKMYGTLIPIPINIKIKKRVVDVCVKAIVIAVPTNGAVHGVANNVAKKPLKKFLLKKPPLLLKIEEFRI